MQRTRKPDRILSSMPRRAADAGRSKVGRSAEAVEKPQIRSFCDFPWPAICWFLTILKSHALALDTFSTASLSWLNFWSPKNSRDQNHLCNNVRTFGGFGYGTYSAIFLLTQMGNFAILASSFSCPQKSNLTSWPRTSGGFMKWIFQKMPIW